MSRPVKPTTICIRVTEATKKMIQERAEVEESDMSGVINRLISQATPKWLLAKENGAAK